MTDPIADYLTRLRNAIGAKHRVVEVPASNLKKEITKILFEKGYILNYKFVEDGPREMSQYVNPAINVTIEDGHVTLTENDKEMLDNPKQKHAFHGLYRSLVHNMVVGVSEGYKKELELVGVGYRASNQGNIIELALGYTHNIFIQLPAEVKVETKSERNKNPLIILESCDKQLLGQVCSKIRSFRKPEPYKGKGIKFVGEVIRRKSGKSAGAK